MRVFVTGASGFVGAAAARRLVRDGHQVVCMSRSAVADERIHETGAAPLRCDLESVTADHLEGTDAVAHRYWPVRRRTLRAHWPPHTSLSSGDKRRCWFAAAERDFELSVAFHAY